MCWIPSDRLVSNFAFHISEGFGSRLSTNCNEMFSVVLIHVTAVVTVALGDTVGAVAASLHSA